MAAKEAIASYPAPALVQQALREVLRGDLVATELPEHLRKDVKGVRGLEGKFVVKGYDVEVRKKGGGEVSAEECKKCYKAVEFSRKLPKVRRDLVVRRDNCRKRWGISWKCQKAKVWHLKLGRILEGGRVVEGRVEQGGLVKLKGPDRKEEVRVREDGKGGILLTIALKISWAELEESVTYMTRRT